MGALFTKHDLTFKPPYLNAAGSLGFAPDPHGSVDLNQLSAFITNPISLTPRKPAQATHCLPFPGGFLLHTGYPNPGFRAALRRYKAYWSRASLPVIVHLLGQKPDDIAGMVHRLEEIPGIAGFELGLPPLADLDLVSTFVQAAQIELPVIIRLPLDQAVCLAAQIAQTTLPLTAVSLGPPRGALPANDSTLVHGRLYGPAIFPFALEVVRSIQKTGLPVIGGGGVYTRAQAETMLAAGAIAVQLDAVLWRSGW